MVVFGGRKVLLTTWRWLGPEKEKKSKFKKLHKKATEQCLSAGVLSLEVDEVGFGEIIRGIDAWGQVHLANAHVC